VFYPALKPFHSDASGTFWTSDSARDFKTFSYTYPELLGTNQQSVNLSTLRTTINNLYGKKASGVNLRPRDVVRRCPDLALRATNEQPRDYLLNMRVAKNGLADSFLIYFFLGDFSPDPAAWATDGNMIGTKAVLSMKAPGQMEPVDVTGSVPLTAVLEKRVERGELPGLEVPRVTQFLRGKLHWRARNVSVVSSSLFSSCLPFLRRHGFRGSCKGAFTLCTMLIRAFSSMADGRLGDPARRGTESESIRCEFCCPASERGR